MRVNEAARRKASFGDGYARFVIAKEIGHATLRHPDMKATLLAKYPLPIRGSEEVHRIMVSAACSMEFHAFVFGTAFLLGPNAARNASPEELSVRHGIDRFSVRRFVTEIPAAPGGPPPESG